MSAADAGRLWKPRRGKPLLEGEAETLTRKAIELGLEGDATALRICMDGIAPPRRDYPTPFDLPEFKEAADARNALAEVDALTSAERSNRERKTRGRSRRWNGDGYFSAVTTLARGIDCLIFTRPTRPRAWQK